MYGSQRNSIRWTVPAAWAAGLALLIGLPALAPARTHVEIRAFQSVKLDGDAVLRGDTSGEPVTLAGELRIPGSGKDKVPAVVLMHPSGGINPAVEAWAQELNGMGVATFMLDSASGRGLSRFSTDPSQLTYLQLVADAYRALSMLAQHPRIDAQRIAIMGFSMGGLPARITSMERFRREFASDGTAFAAHISLYGACNTALRDSDKVTGKPIRMFVGTEDDFAPVAPCRALVARLRQAGADVTLTTFPGARHYFDAAFLKKPIYAAKATSRRNCELKEGDGGQILDARTDRPFDPKETCNEMGGSVEYNPDAAAATKASVKDFLTTVFHLKR